MRFALDLRVFDVYRPLSCRLVFGVIVPQSGKRLTAAFGWQD